MVMSITGIENGQREQTERDEAAQQMVTESGLGLPGDERVDHRV
jgi:hypothetical protein